MLHGQRIISNSCNYKILHGHRTFSNTEIIYWLIIGSALSPVILVYVLREAPTLLFFIYNQFAS